MKKYLLLITMLVSTQTAFAFNSHISEESTVNYRSGPSIKYRIKGTLSSGDSITVINNHSSKRFYKVRIANGKTGWVASNKIKKGDSNTSKITALTTSMNDSVALIKKQADEIQRLKMLLNLQKEQNVDQSNKQTELTSKISVLNNQVNSLDDSNLIRWLTHASTITIFGIFMVFLVSIFRKRKKFNHIY